MVDYMVGKVFDFLAWKQSIIFLSCSNVNKVPFKESWFWYIKINIRNSSSKRKDLWIEFFIIRTRKLKLLKISFSSFPKTFIWKYATFYEYNFCTWVSNANLVWKWIFSYFYIFLALSHWTLVHVEMICELQGHTIEG